jgi:hypothetical protein
MNQDDIQPGRDYGYRPNPRRHTDLERVNVIERVRRQWKVEWVDPNPGLQDYVKSANLVVPWNDRRPFLRDEQCSDRLLQSSEATWPGPEHPLTEAVDTVFAATGENLATGSCGALSVTRDALVRTADRARVDVPDSPPAFVDRHGTVHLPFDHALALAKAFAAAEPQSVLLQVDAIQREYEAEARDAGNAYIVPLVNRWRAGWALCRQWAGFDQALAERDAEIERLRRIIDDTRYELRRAGNDELAARLDRKLKGR